jgi:hypothetical protein
MQVGSWSALFAFVATVGYDFSQVFQVVGLIFHPTDATLVYGTSLLIATPAKKSFWSQTALFFSHLLDALDSQLRRPACDSTPNPAGAYDQMRVLDQTPHSLFWAVDGLGHASLGQSTLSPHGSVRIQASRDGRGGSSWQTPCYPLGRSRLFLSRLFRNASSFGFSMGRNRSKLHATSGHISQISRLNVTRRSDCALRNSSAKSQTDRQP